MRPLISCFSLWVGQQQGLHCNSHWMCSCISSCCLPPPASSSPEPGTSKAPPGRAPDTSAGLWSCHLARNIFLLVLIGSFCLCEFWLVFMGSHFFLISPVLQPDFPHPSGLADLQQLQTHHQRQTQQPCTDFTSSPCGPWLVTFH